MFNPHTVKGSFDHIVGGSEQRGRHGESKRFGGLEIDDEIKFGRLLDRKVARLRSAQNFVDIFGNALEQSRKVCSVRSRSTIPAGKQRSIAAQCFTRNFVPKSSKFTVIGRNWLISDFHFALAH
jgi:hypothetical protein